MKPDRSASPRSPPITPTMMPVTTPAQIGLPWQINATAASWTRLPQFWRRKLPMALKMGFQKQLMKQ